MGDIINGVASEYEMTREPKLYETSARIQTGNLLLATPKIKVVEYPKDFRHSFENEVNELISSGYSVLSVGCTDQKYMAVLITR